MRYAGSLSFYITDPGWYTSLEESIDRNTSYSTTSRADCEQRGLHLLDPNQMYLTDEDMNIYRAHIAREDSWVVLVLFDLEEIWGFKDGSIEIEYNTIDDGVVTRYHGGYKQGNVYFYSVYIRPSSTNEAQCVGDYLSIEDALGYARQIMETGDYRIIDNTKPWRTA